MLKRSLLIAANNKRLEARIGSDPRTKKLVSRFVAGTTLDDAVRVTTELNARGIDVSFDLLGETVETLAEADTAREGYAQAVERIASYCPEAPCRSSSLSSGSGWTRRSVSAIWRS